jgi:prepilin-type N-terminal cleavage/methylation domain-containing protein
MRRGFSLIELLVTVAIIGVLAAFAANTFAGAREKTYVSAIMGDLKKMAGAQEVRFDRLDNNLGTFEFTGDDGLRELASRDFGDAILTVLDWQYRDKNLSVAQNAAVDSLYSILDFVASPEVTVVVVPTFIVTEGGLYQAKGYTAVGRHTRAPKRQCVLTFNTAVQTDAGGVPRSASLGPLDQVVRCS